MTKDEILASLEGLTESEVDALLAQVVALETRTPLDYEPHAKQKVFHMVTVKTRCVLGGNRSGKTECGTLEAWWHSSGDYPEWYPKESRFSGPTRGRIIGPDFKKWGMEVLEPKLRSWFPADRVIKWQYFMGHLEKIKIRHKDGGVSTIDIMSHEQDDMAFEGWSGHWAWFDEPPPREKFVGTKRGLIDYNGIAWMTMTPITEPWLWDELIDREDGRVWHCVMSIYDNTIEKGGYLTPEAIEEFIATSGITDEEKDARLFGVFKHLTGRVYKDLDKDVHRISEAKFRSMFKPTWPVFFVLDPADRRAQHGIWATVDPMNTIYIFDEYVQKGTIKETAKNIKLRESLRWGLKPSQVVRIIDPNKGNTPDSVTGLKMAENFALEDIHFITNVNDDVRIGHLAVAELLTWDKKAEIGATNHPKLYFVQETAPITWKQINTYVWDDWKGNSKGSRSEKEKVKDINTDLPDCVRYLAVFNPIWYDASKVEADPEYGSEQSFKLSFLD